MTHDEMIAVIQGHKDGKTIQYFSRVFRDWRQVVGNPTFNFAGEQYRVKPEPRTIEVVYGKMSGKYVTTSLGAANVQWYKNRLQEYTISIFVEQL